MILVWLLHVDFWGLKVFFCSLGGLLESICICSQWSLAKCPPFWLKWLWRLFVRRKHLQRRELPHSSVASPTSPILDGRWRLARKHVSFAKCLPFWPKRLWRLFVRREQVQRRVRPHSSGASPWGPILDCHGGCSLDGLAAMLLGRQESVLKARLLEMLPSCSWRIQLDRSRFPSALVCFSVPPWSLG